MAKTHVEPRSPWTEEEERAVYDGYISRMGLDWIVQQFPTDRQFESIRLKFANHVWEDTNGKQGLRGGNKWVKTKWARHRANTLPYHFERIKELREEVRDLRTKLKDALDSLEYHQKRTDEMLYFPN